MDLQPLTACVATALRENRVRFGDVRRLERALPRGAVTLDALELLLGLDRAVSRTDRAWAEFLVDRTRGVVVDSAPEERRVIAERIVALVGERPTAAGAAIRSDLALELLGIDPDLAGVFAPPQPRQAARRRARVPSMAFASAPLVPDLPPDEAPAADVAVPMAADASDATAPVS